MISVSIMYISHLRQLIFLRKSDCLGCAVLLYLVVCLTLFASFFLLSLISHCMYTFLCNYQLNLPSSRILPHLADSTEATPLQQRVWFILVMFGLGVFLVVAIVMTVCGLRFARKEQRKYSSEWSDLHWLYHSLVARSITDQF